MKEIWLKIDGSAGTLHIQVQLKIQWKCNCTRPKFLYGSCIAAPFKLLFAMSVRGCITTQKNRMGSESLSIYSDIIRQVLRY